MSAYEATAVLIVEDERLVAKDLQKSLGEMGYDAFAIAASAEEALECASAKAPDVVLMDIRIKGPTDGIQTAAILKEKFPVVVIYLTAHADDAMLDRAKPTEPAGYLVKPVKNIDLRSMIEISLHQRSAHQQRDRARRLEKQLFTLTANVPIAIAYFDLKNHVRFANRIFCELVSYPDNPVGVPAMAFLGEPLFKQSYSARQKALLGDAARFMIALHQGGQFHHYEMTYLPNHDADGNVTGVYAIGYDVTRREQLSDDLARAHHDWEIILNAVPARITSWDRDGTNRFANAAARLQWGTPNARTVGRSMHTLLGDDCYKSVRPLIDKVLTGEQCTGEHTEEQADGLHYWHDEYLPEMKNGKSMGLYALSFDVTEIYRSNEHIRRLVQRLEAVREEERRSVATILHDGIAQDLFAMKLGIEYQCGQDRRDGAMAAFCQELSVSVTKCMGDIRQLANELRPIALSRMGLTAVITEHARRFAERAGLIAQITAPPQFPELAESTQLLLFRAAQEALTNVARHAKATTVELTLRANLHQVTLDVADNGVGITDANPRNSKSLGLLALMERFAALGGNLTITRNEPHGTRLSFTVPCPPAADLA